MLLFCQQNAGQNPEVKITNRNFQSMAQFRYLGWTVIVQNLIHEEMRLSTGNACYHSVQNLLSSRLPSKNVKIIIQNYNFACGSIWL
jgi:hypothetical protein